MYRDNQRVNSVALGQVLMNFTRGEDGKWDVIWHSHISDYDAIKSVIIRHDEPEDLIAELRHLGFQVGAIIEDEPDDVTRH